MILTLITLGKCFEQRSKAQTTDAISKLVDLAPKRARVVRDGAEVEVATAEVRVGERVVVRAGETVLAAVLVFLYYRRMCEKDFGGLSGDLAGWFLQTEELWMLAAMAVRQYGEAAL